MSARQLPVLPEHLREIGITGGAFFVQGRPQPVVDAQWAKDAVEDLRATITKLADERDVLAARVRELEESKRRAVVVVSDERIASFFDDGACQTCLGTGEGTKFVTRATTKDGEVIEGVKVIFPCHVCKGTGRTVKA